MNYSNRLLIVAIAACLSTAVPVRAFTLTFSNADFASVSPVFSNVVTFNYAIDVGAPLTPGQLYADPAINTIEYNVSGGLAPGTPSGFSGFGFQLSHLVTGAPAPPTSIDGSLFYALNGDPILGETLRFQLLSTADLSNGIQINELADLGGGVVFRINGRETGEDGRPGRYHPAFLELKSDGTGRIQNANNQGGVNPATSMIVDVDFGEEYITDVSFDPRSFTIAIPEPSAALLAGFSVLVFLRRRR